MIEISDEEPIKGTGKVWNGKSTKKLTKEFIEESDEYSDEYSDGELNEIFKESTEIEKSNKDECTADWHDKRISLRKY